LHNASLDHSKKLKLDEYEQNLFLGRFTAYPADTPWRFQHSVKRNVGGLIWILQLNAPPKVAPRKKAIYAIHPAITILSVTAYEQKKTRSSRAFTWAGFDQ